MNTDTNSDATFTCPHCGKDPAIGGDRGVVLVCCDGLASQLPESLSTHAEPISRATVLVLDDRHEAVAHGIREMYIARFKSISRK